MRTLVVALLLALLGAVVIAVGYPPSGVEAQLLHLRLAQTMPDAAESMADEQADVQALLVDYSRDPVLLGKARLALLRYPDMARQILPLYGDLPEFQAVLSRYGEDALLPIQYFLDNDVSTLHIMQGADRAGKAIVKTMHEWWFGISDDAVQDTDEPQVMTPEIRGEYAIQFLQAEGYDFLGQFVVDKQAKVSWVQTERVLEGVNSLFVGGIRTLESRLRQDEAIGASDVGWAAVDVAVGVSAFKLLKMGRAGAAARGTTAMSFSQRSAMLGSSLWRGTTVGARLAKYGAPLVLAYVAVRHPSVLNAMVGRVAQNLGVPAALIQVLGWALVLLPIMLLLRYLLRPLSMLFGGVAAVFAMAHRLLSRKPTAAVDTQKA